MYLLSCCQSEFIFIKKHEALMWGTYSYNHNSSQVLNDVVPSDRMTDIVSNISQF